ncbi:unnamed protein product [Microthlaspi erraticum]|uniref:DUF4283 domain-containing protein n=2 Tax=Microthlaspi erraticum TaxID=1685480 RepID=A0A6D2IRQ3_9BRAS|nr:unnamed protein product [Microthlaspi erraticum]
MASGESPVIDFDVLMPSSGRRMDSIGESTLSPSINLTTEDLQGMKSSSPSPLNPPKLTELPSSTLSPDPRWPLLNRWSTKPSPPLAVTEQHSAKGASNSGDSSPKTVVPDTAPPISSVPLITTIKPVISKGAWDKPLVMHSAHFHQTTEPLQVPLSSHSQWPALSDRNKGTSKNRLHTESFKKSARDSSESEAELALLKAHSKDYPWAAKMNPSTRNLHRVTIPEYMDDGTPKVRIPSHVLLGGVENQKEYVVGQFSRCSAPSRGQIQAIVSMIWGRKCQIFIRKLGESTYLFHIPHESTRNWVIQRGLWHIDDCLMFVSPWSPTETISIPEITTIPVLGNRC